MKTTALSVLCLAAAFSVADLAAADAPKAAPIETVFRDTSGWFRVEFPLDDTNLDRIDLSGLLDAAAGKRGFVTTRLGGAARRPVFCSESHYEVASDAESAYRARWPAWPAFLNQTLTLQTYAK